MHMGCKGIKFYRENDRKHEKEAKYLGKFKILGASRNKIQLAPLGKYFQKPYFNPRMCRCLVCFRPLCQHLNSKTCCVRNLPRIYQGTNEYCYIILLQYNTLIFQYNTLITLYLLAYTALFRTRFHVKCPIFVFNIRYAKQRLIINS